jgi:hypothetical protein
MDDRDQFETQPLEKLITIPRKQKWVTINSTVLSKVALHQLNHEVHFALEESPICHVHLWRNPTLARIESEVTIKTYEEHWPNEPLAAYTYTTLYAESLAHAAGQVVPALIRNGHPVSAVKPPSLNTMTYSDEWQLPIRGDEILQTLYQTRDAIVRQLKHILTTLTNGPS